MPTALVTCTPKSRTFADRGLHSGCEDTWNRRLVFRELGAAKHKFGSDANITPPLTIAGPLWTGPLHSAEWLASMSAVAAARGWTGQAYPPDADVKSAGHNPPRALEKLLRVLQEEADPALPPWFVPLSDVLKFGRLANIPPRDDLIAALRAKGYAACASHVEVRRHTRARVLHPASSLRT
jgi:tRNA G26 N,N-dimethylase Trm1